MCGLLQGNMAVLGRHLCKYSIRRASLGGYIFILVFLMSILLTQIQALRKQGSGYCELLLWFRQNTHKRPVHLVPSSLCIVPVNINHYDLQVKPSELTRLNWCEIRIGVTIGFWVCQLWCLQVELIVISFQVVFVGHSQHGLYIVNAVKESKKWQLKLPRRFSSPRNRAWPQ